MDFYLPHLFISHSKNGSQSATTTTQKRSQDFAPGFQWLNLSLF